YQYLSQSPSYNPALHSFPTRRSSDLIALRQLGHGSERWDGTRPSHDDGDGAHRVSGTDGDGDAVACPQGFRALHSGAGCARVDSDRKSTRLNSSHVAISYAVFCLKKK